MPRLPEETESDLRITELAARARLWNALTAAVTAIADKIVASLQADLVARNPKPHK